MTSADQLREQILQQVAAYTLEAFAPQAFVPGQTAIPVAGRVFDAAENDVLRRFNSPAKRDCAQVVIHQYRLKTDCHPSCT